MKKSLLLLIIIMFAACQDCEDDSGSINLLDCNLNTTVSSLAYQNSISSPVSISFHTITENCLALDYNASGCDGSSWEVELIASEDILEANPPQRNLKLILINQELCTAVIQQEMTFDITNLQVANNNSVLLNIDEITEPILYEY
ncbi:hypothetical protein [Mesonia mobilis]|uniref:hypothetical protein n=1 Tax=Mesonia mobilis TaxID=369791 RepID=UPI0026EF4063|nr:hypothetical protein [Mesonia mobilis]